MNQIQLNPRAIAAGLLMPQSQPGEEPRLTDAGLLYMLGALAHDEEADEETRQHYFAGLRQVLEVAKRPGDFNDSHEQQLLFLLAKGVDPLGDSDKEKLLSVLCRLVAVSVGPGRVGSLISGDLSH